ncbi:MAG: GCN5 family acetyltransferase [Desulfovibrio sp. S3730MH75]|nr:MAG: GCN5 family acetyltransferase [Desulfovibrio sp. S3730MH75]
MSREELNWAIDMAANEGWNPGLHDVDTFYEQDPDGFLVGLLGNVPIGCISAVGYDGGFGFIGFYIVVPEFRGKGYGIQLWKAAMAKLKGYNIGLDGVFDQQENYRKSGFTFQYSNLRFEYRNKLHGKLEPSPEIKSISSDDLTEISGYDQLLFPANRDPFLRSWLSMQNSISLASYKKGQLSGYGTIRLCRTGYKIGPLFANDMDVGRLLFRNLCSQVKAGAPIYLDIPEINEAGIALAQEYDMLKVFGTARMYTGEPPNLDLQRVFGVTTFELG